jgi:hypothetical protein
MGDKTLYVIVEKNKQVKICKMVEIRRLSSDLVCKSIQIVSRKLTKEINFPGSKRKLKCKKFNSKCNKERFFGIFECFNITKNFDMIRDISIPKFGDRTNDM